MLRRLAIVTRRGLFLVGAVLMLAWPFSYFFTLQGVSPWPFDVASLTLQDGQLYVYGLRDPSTEYHQPWVKVFGPSHRVYPLHDDVSPIRPTWALYRLPTFSHAWISIPIWLLALLILVWPVLSLIARRQPDRRGFAIERASVSEASGV